MLHVELRKYYVLGVVDVGNALILRLQALASAAPGRIELHHHELVWVLTEKTLVVLLVG
jgi:hypothetical protein